jgi:hypothetical protein
VPADDALVEDFHVAVAIFVENAIGQTGQVMWASSIQHDWPVLGNAWQICLELGERRGQRAQNMHLAEFLLRAYVDDQRFFPGFNVFHELIDGDE